MHFSINTRKFLSCSILFLPAITMSSAIPVTPSMPMKMASSLDWKMSCATTVPIGSHVHWNLPNGSAIQVSFLKIWIKYCHPVDFLEVYNGKNSHTLQFCCCFIHRSCMVWFPLQDFIQVPWIQTYPQFLLNCVIW